MQSRSFQIFMIQTLFYRILTCSIFHTKSSRLIVFTLRYIRFRSYGGRVIEDKRGEFRGFWNVKEKRNVI